MTRNFVKEGEAWSLLRDCTLFDYPALYAFADENRERFAGANPFPHIVIDGFLTPAVAQLLCGAAHTPVAAERACWELNSGSFLEFLERLTGMQRLLPDPYLDADAGVAATGRGQTPRLHPLCERHPVMQIDRMLCLQICLSADWDPAWGGELVLQDPSDGSAAHRVAPLAGRCVIFSAGGAPRVAAPAALRCPDGVSLRTLTLYYYAPDPALTP